MPRKKTFQTFREARKLGSYAEMPMLPDETHVQVHLSRNDRPQPFYVICEADTLLLLMSGAGRVHFRETSVRDFGLAPGDCVYVPAGAPHRLVPDAESVILRYKPRAAGLEGIAWYCAACDREICRHVWDTARHLSQEEYLAGGARFNHSETARTCRACGVVHPLIDFTQFAWSAVAAAIHRE